LAEGLGGSMGGLFHINEPIRLRPDLYGNFCKLGRLGVPVFFVISGWCMSQLEQNAQVPSRFMIARWFRIYPPYIISVVLKFAVIGLSVAWRGVNDLHVGLPKTPVALLSIIGMATDPATATPNINWSYWTLPVEFAFYIIIYMAIVVSLMRSTSRRKNAGIVSLALLGSGAVILLQVKTSATILFWMPFSRCLHWGAICIGCCLM
jgi:peptidoglycan/LPS O-acetylase OafA/YrhL